MEKPFLIIGFGGIGDHVRCFALARHVARQSPGVPIDFLCRSPVHRLVRFVPELRRAHLDDTPHKALGLKAKLALAGRLRREGYGRVYVVSRSFKAGLVPFLAGIPERVGWFGEGRLLLINRPRFGDRRIHGETERVCALSRPDGRVPDERLTPRLVVPETELAAFRAAQPPEDAGRPVLALAPGAYNAVRLWPVEKFAQVARTFTAQGWVVWVLGGPQERAAAAAIAAHVPVRDLTHAPLDEAVVQLAAADLFLGSDSGMLHVAGAVGVPSIGLFGPTQLEVTGPSNSCVAQVRPPAGSIELDDVLPAQVSDALFAHFSRMQHPIGTFRFTEEC